MLKKKKMAEAATELPKTSLTPDRGLRVRCTSPASSPPQHFFLLTSMPSFSIFQTSLPVSVFYFLHSPIHLCFLYSCHFPILTHVFFYPQPPHPGGQARANNEFYLFRHFLYKKKQRFYKVVVGVNTIMRKKVSEETLQIIPNYRNHIFF